LVPLFSSTAEFSHDDLALWVQELRERNPCTFGESQANYATNQRQNRAKQITLDAVTAALLLKDDAMGSGEGKAVLSQFILKGLFVHADLVQQCLDPGVRELVPSMQSMFNTSLSAENRVAIVEAVIRLPFKDKATASWVKTVLTDVNRQYRVFTNGNFEAVRSALGQANPPTRTRAPRQLNSQARAGGAAQEKVCIAGFVSEHGRGFSCAQVRVAASSDSSSESSESTSGESSESSSDSSDDADASSEGGSAKVSGSIASKIYSALLQKTKPLAPRKVIRSFRSAIDCTLLSKEKKNAQPSKAIRAPSEVSIKYYHA